MMGTVDLIKKFNCELVRGRFRRDVERASFTR